MATDNDFRGLDLRGESFRAQDLSGADFSDADVRGADFTDARLTHVNFTNARLGVRPVAGAALLVAALAASVAAGVVIGFFADTIRQSANAADWRDQLAGWLLVLIVVVFFGFLIFRGIKETLWASAITLIIVVTVGFVLVYSIAGELRFLNSLWLVGLLLLSTVAVMAGILGRIVGGGFGAAAIGIVAVLGGLAAGRAHGGLAAIVVSMLLVYVSKRALKFDDRDRVLRELAQRIVTRRGTHFTRADISDADFTGTMADQPGVPHATLADATWEGGKEPTGVLGASS